MRRVLTTVGTTIAAIVLLLQFETRQALVQPSAQAAQVTTTQGPIGATTAGTSTTGATTSTSTTSTTTPTTTTSTTEQPVTVDMTGPAIETRWGTVQIKVTIENGTLVDVASLQLPDERSYSRYVSSVAGPMLRSEALSAQSADIDNISGATYTSRGYVQSLQAALDSAGL
jgi:uncharacterized protein with FMN-binding domain